MSSITLEAAPTAPAKAALAADDDDDVVLAVHSISKHYKLWASPSVRLRYSLLSQAHRTLRTVLPEDSAPLAALHRRRAALHQDFTALDELSFQVRRGESLGIIGRNGAGKSTLLQIIAGSLQPSTGRVDVYGRIAALLELGSGFNPEYTGTENVYLNASLLGFSKEEIDAKFDGIASFADIGQFLEQPVKTYSSGMMVRLAFSVQMAVEPMIFIIDEALAVGDIYFQNKCNKLLRRKLDEGLTLLLVSHSPGSIRALCQRGLVLDRGKCAFIGPSDEAVNVYHALGDIRRDDSPGAVDIAAASLEAEQSSADESGLAATAQTQKSPLPVTTDRPEIPQGLGQIQDEIGTREVVITGCALYNSAGKPCHEFTPGEPIRVGYTLLCRADIEDALLGFAIRDGFNNVVSALTTVNQGLTIHSLKKDRLYAVYLTLTGRLGSGEYLLDLGIGGTPDAAGSPTMTYHRVGGINHFGLSWGAREVKFQGICNLDAVFEPPQPIAPSAGQR